MNERSAVYGNCVPVCMHGDIGVQGCCFMSCLAVHMSISNPFELLMEIVSISGAV